MNKLFFGHTHYVPDEFLCTSNMRIGAVIVPEMYPNLIYSYYDEVEYFRSIPEFIFFFNAKKYRIQPVLYAIENINLLPDIQNIATLKKLGVCSVQLYHHLDNKYFDIRNGLTKLGEHLLSTLYNENIALDLSHLNDYWINALLSFYPGRIIVSHCAISDTKKHDMTNRANNISLRTTDKLISKGAIIGISFVNDTIALNTDEQRDDVVYENIVEEVQYLLSCYGSKYFFIGPDYFDSEYFSRVYKKRIFIPHMFYTVEGYYKMYSELRKYIVIMIWKIFFGTMLIIFMNLYL